MEKTLSVKITPPDGVWQTSKRLAKIILKECEKDKELSKCSKIAIEIDEVYSDSKNVVNINNNFGQVKNALSVVQMQ